MEKTTLQIHVMYQAVICFDNVKVKVFIMLTFENEYDLKQITCLFAIDRFDKQPEIQSIKSNFIFILYLELVYAN